jgi:hypothetical protein
VNLGGRCYCLHPNGPYRHFRWNRPETDIPNFLQLSRELRDQIYSEYISLQKGTTWSHWSLSPYNQNRCAFGSCETEPFPPVRVDFPLLFANRQIRSELQEKLVQQRFSLHFDCCCTLDHFLKNEHNIIFKNSLQAISFHWGGLQSDRAIIQLQKLPNLKRRTIHITQSIPLNERGEFIFQEMGVEVKQDYICKVTHAVGFDELCSIRGLDSDVQVKIGNEMCFTQEEVLSQYFSKFLTRAQPPVSNSLASQPEALLIYLGLRQKAEIAGTLRGMVHGWGSELDWGRCREYGSIQMA